MAEVSQPAREEGTEIVEIEAIASAPGDLPLAAIIARQAAQRTQFRHDNTILPLAPTVGQPVEVWATSGEEMPVERAMLFYTTDGSRPTSSSPALNMERARFEWDVRAGYLVRWLARVPAQPAGTLVRYRIAGWLAHPGATSPGEPEVWAQDGQGFAFRFSAERAFTTFAYTVEEIAEPRLPAWVEDAVIYQIFLDRFRADGDFPAESEPQALHGGTLNGVRAALPYLAESGATCLWLSPVHVAETYHRYDALDYCTVDPRLGTNADLKALIDEIHARGMRILLDFVPAHISWHHPDFLAAQADQQAPSYNWFYFEQWPDLYGNFMDRVPYLPSFRAESDGARQHIIASAVHWLRDYEVDGFRLDHAIGLSMDFWSEFRRATRAAQPAVFSLGEATDTPDSLLRYRGKLDAILDFPLAAALRYTFGTRTWNLSRLEHFLTAYEQYMAAGAGRVSFLDNHDMNRFLFLAENRVELLKLAALCQFTLAPIPAIYYGTEVGLSQRVDIATGLYGGDAEARRDMSWQPESWNHDLLSFYRALTHMRTSLPILARGKRHTLHLDDNQQTYAYLRTNGSGQELDAGDTLVMLNLSASIRTLTFSTALLPELTTLVLTTGAEPVMSRGLQQVEIILAPFCGAVFSLQEAQRG
jgi:glycosidase